MNTTVNSTARSTGKKKADAPRALTLKPVHMRKLAAIIDVKSRALFSKNFIIMPVFSLGFTFLMQVIYEKASGGVAAMNAYALAPCHGNAHECLHDGLLLHCRISGRRKRKKYAAHPDDLFCQRT